ncbi:MAG: hypothetical protein JO112_23050, partial [Planctomycetes bacterium]|nr:hypothetical protein [Planctomycetota bacterium]
WVAAAVYLGTAPAGPVDLWFRVATAVPFWPLYLPILLSGQAAPEKSQSSPKPSAVKDDMAAAIAQVEAELEAALGSLDGWAEGVLAREKDRLQELRGAWNAQAHKIREMDLLLALPEPDGDDNEVGNTLLPCPTGLDPAADRLRHSLQARRQNLERLRRVRQRAAEDLMATLAWVRELVSMIHLAKFTGAPASRAEELVAQIAAAVEGLSELTWQDDPSVHAGGST